LGAWPGRIITGPSITAIITVISTGTGMIPNHPGITLKLTIKNPDLKFIPGITGDIILPPGIAIFTKNMHLFINRITDIITTKVILSTLTDIAHIRLYTLETDFISEPRFLNRGFS